MPQTETAAPIRSSVVFGSPRQLTGTTWIASVASATWPTANRAKLYPVVLPRPTVVKQLFWENGAAVSGNVDCGIYDEQGTLIVSTGGVAQSGTSTSQVVDIADTLIGPGLFYVALVLDNTTGTIIRSLIAERNVHQTGWAEAASAYPLPATITMVTHGVNNHKPEGFGFTVEGTF